MTNRNELFTRLGRSASELANLDMNTFQSLNKSELSHVVTRLASTANKRLKRFEAKGETSPAYKGAMKSGGKFSAKGKTLNQLRAEYARLSRFINAPTGTIKGAAKVRKDIIDRLGFRGVKLPENFLETFWDVYNDMTDTRFLYGTSQTAQENLADIVYQVWDDDKNYDNESDYTSLINKVRDTLTGNYENDEAENDESDYMYI